MKMEYISYLLELTHKIIILFLVQLSVDAKLEDVTGEPVRVLTYVTKKGEYTSSRVSYSRYTFQIIYIENALNADK